MAIPSTIVAAASVFPMTLVATTRGQLPLRVVMLAIGGAESGWTADADGDCGLGGPSCGGCPGQSGAATSWGVWQIHNVHGAYLTQMSGSGTACDWRAWLFNPHNNAVAALNIYQSQGLGAWSTYTSGAWLNYLAEAQAAVNVTAAVVAPGPSAHAYAIPGLSAVTTSPLAVFGGILLLGGLGIAAFEADTHRARIREWFGRQLRRGTITSKGD